jgi:hypothetical protein
MDLFFYHKGTRRIHEGHNGVLRQALFYSANLRIVLSLISTAGLNDSLFIYFRTESNNCFDTTLSSSTFLRSMPQTKSFPPPVFASKANASRLFSNQVSIG